MEGNVKQRQQAVELMTNLYLNRAWARQSLKLSPKADVADYCFKCAYIDMNHTQELPQPLRPTGSALNYMLCIFLAVGDD